MSHPANFSILTWLFNEQYTEHRAQAILGDLPAYLSPDSIAPAWEQLRDHHPWGWEPLIPLPDRPWTIDADGYLHYPGQMPLAPAALAQLRSEQIFVYPFGYVAICQPNGDFSLARYEP